MNGVYKILRKILTERLKSMLRNLVSDYQCEGLQGKQIHERIVIANELIDSRRSTIHGLAFKIDFLKGFDTMSWAFVIRLLEEHGFSG